MLCIYASACLGSETLFVDKKINMSENTSLKTNLLIITLCNKMETINMGCVHKSIKSIFCASCILLILLMEFIDSLDEYLD